MAITKTNQPYEFLVRWNEGVIAGAHIRFLETIIEDGVTLSKKEGHAMPVSMAGGAGYPLEDILSPLQAQALNERDAAVTALATAQARIAELEAQVGTPAPTPTQVTSVTPRQMRQALTQMGLRGPVEAAVAAADQDLQDWWEYSTAFERERPQVAAMAQALGVVDTQLDALWALAATL